MAIINGKANPTSVHGVKNPSFVNGVPLYLLQDRFTTPLAAGSINGTAAEPGPGARIVVDTTGKLSITGGRLVFSGSRGVWGDPICSFGPYTRVPGLMCIGEITISNTTHYQGFGFGIDTSTSYFLYGGIYLFSDGSIRTGGASRPIGTYSAGSYKIAVCLRTTGFYFLQYSGSNWLLGYADTGSAATPLYINIANYDGTPTYDYIKTPTSLWLPAPLASDGFGSTWGTTDGLGHAEGVAGGIGSGGGGKTWITKLGTWANAAGKARATVLDGTALCAIATCDVGTADVWVTVDVTLATLAGGQVLRYIDTNNYLYATIVAGTCSLIQVKTGTPTTLITAIATYGAGKPLVVDLIGTMARLYYNEALVGTGTVDAAFSSATLMGLYTADTGNTFDNWCVYAKGTAGEYAVLNQF